jgi:hypothetical protein
VNETHTSLPKKRSGWIGFFSACLLLLLIALLIGFSWWHSDADLVEVRKLAVENNIPVTWEEFGLKKSEPDRLARWKRIVALSNKLSSYQSLKIPDKPNFVLFSPIPDEMRAHHAKLDEMTWTELLNEIELLGDQPLCFHETITFDTRMPEIGEYRDLLQLLQERMVLVETPEALRICSSQLALCRSFDNNSQTTHLIKISLTSRTLNSISDNLVKFKTIHSQLAEDVTRTTEHYLHLLSQGLTGEILFRLHTCAERKIDNMHNYSWYMPLIIRAGRQALLNTEIESLTYIRNHDLLTTLTWRREEIALFQEWTKKNTRPVHIFWSMTLTDYDFLINLNYETQLKGRLLAAELKNQPWPQDIFDPTGATLRPVLRDGKIIGAYTVGSNGIDDGGDKKLDRYFPLYGPLELPVAPTTP